MPDTNASRSAVALSIVVPLYNEDECVQHLCQVITQFCEAAEYNFELILVDDGSRDMTQDLIHGAARLDSRIRPVILQRNFGQTAAMSAGIDMARYPLIVTMDGDMQNDPRDIPLLLAKFNEGYDVVSGWRKNRQDRMLSRKIPSILANRLIGSVTGVRLHDYGCSLKLYRACILKQVRLYGDMHRFIPALCAFNGARVAEVEVSHHARTTGQSKYGISRTFRVILDLITVKLLLSYATRPLHFFGAAAATLLGLAVVAFLVAIAMKFSLSPISLNRNPIFYFTILLAIAAFQTISVGLLAELIMRTNFESQNKSIYKIKQMDRFTPGTDADASVNASYPVGFATHADTNPL